MSQSSTIARPRKTSTDAATRQDCYQRITATIVEQLEKGVRPWARSWNADQLAGRINRPLRSNGERYRGINVLALWISAQAQGFTSPYWFTFNQAKDLGGMVRKGEKGTLVVYAGSFTKTETDQETGEDVEKDIPFMKGYTVFNADQVDGIPARFTHAPQLDAINPETRIEEADQFFANTGANVMHIGSQPCYVPSQDKILMPAFEAFHSAEAYYATLAHECIHWTKGGDRTGRETTAKRWGDEGYAREELVAEIGAAFLAADLDIENEPREDHAAYLGHWIKVMRGDSRAIFQAAALAQKAADYLHARQPRESDQADEPAA